MDSHNINNTSSYPQVPILAVDVEKCLRNVGEVSDTSRPILTAFILFFALFGVISNIILLYGFVLNWKKFFRSQLFTFFVLNMIIAGLIYSTTNLWVSVPCTLNKCAFISTDVMMIAMATQNTLGYWAYLFSSAALTTYRFGIYVSKHFEKRKSFIKLCAGPWNASTQSKAVVEDLGTFLNPLFWNDILLIFPWALSIVIITGSTSFGCYKRYNRFALAYTFGCSNCQFFPFFSYNDLNFYSGQVVPLLMVAAYAFILFSIYHDRKINAAFTRRQALVDARLATQFIIICCFQYLNTLLFHLIPKMSNKGDVGVIALNCIGTINVSINPVVLLLFNQQVRSSICAATKKHLPRHIAVTKTAQVVGLKKDARMAVHHHNM